MKKGQIDKRRNIPEKYKPSDWLLKAPYRPDSEFIPSERTRLYEAIGKSISTWEVLECLLMTVFVRLLGGNPKAARRCYGSILVSSARLNMLLETGKAVLSAEEYKTLKTLSTDIIKLTGFRNQIAHGTVAHVDKEGNVWTDNPDSENTTDFILTPPVYNAKKTSPANRKITCYVAEDIDSFISETRKLQVRASHFLGKPIETIEPEFIPKFRFKLGKLPQ